MHEKKYHMYGNPFAQLMYAKKTFLQKFLESDEKMTWLCGS
jgi:hypothetical protein